MILSVSRRTDIPAFYTTWFMNRIREGFVLVRNPMNYHQVSRISLDPAVIDCIVFWTKRADPLMPHLDEIASCYSFYFQYTLNAYGKDVEQNVPSLGRKLETFCTLADKYGSSRIIWRYDPVLLTMDYTVDWHISQFEHIAKALRGKIRTCVFSFIDIYDKVKNNVKDLGVRGCLPEETDKLAQAFSAIAADCGFGLRTCAEAVDLDKYGIRHGCCIDGELIAELTGWTLKAKKDPNQRSECGCLESIDIGQYNTCRNGCRYCYANFNPKSVATFSQQHDPSSPLLIGRPEPDDRVTDRRMKSLKDALFGEEQLSLF